MNTNALVSQTKIETMLMLRRREAVFFSIFLPVMFIFLFGSIYGSQIDQSNGVKVISYLVPGYLVMAVMSISLVSLGIILATERQFGILKRLGATPLPRAYLLLGKIAAASVIVIGATLALLAIGVFYYGATIRGNAFEIAVIILLGIVVFATIGLTISGMVKADAAPAILNAIYLPMLFIGGAIIPIAQMPEWLQQIGQVLPSYHFSVALVNVMTFGNHLTDVWPHLLALIGWGVASAFVALRTFKWEG